MKIIQETLELCGIVMDRRHAAQLPALSLAYLGDTVFDLYVRTWLVKEQVGDVGEMHKLATSVVNASAQAHYVRSIMDRFTEEEKDVFMRGRNAKPGTVPKNMSVGDYHYATGLEAVIGYLYLCGQIGRIQELLKDLKLTGPEDKEASVTPA